MRRPQFEEAPPESDAREGAPHPRSTAKFFGNPAAEAALIETWRAGRIPQSWIFAGPEGVGKATLAWRFARFLFAHPESRSGADPQPENLNVSRENPVFSKVNSLALGDLCLLRREWNTKVRPPRHFTEIRVDDVRAAIGMFQLASAAGGWRICIIDSADDLNKSSANALLKLIEEPPPRSLFIFISQRPGQILPTIRSRSRLLTFQPLEPDDVRGALVNLGEPWSRNTKGIDEIATLARGSVSRALRLLDPAKFAHERRVAGLLGALPRVDWSSVHDLSDRVSANTAIEDYEATIVAVLEWLNARIHEDLPPARLAPYAEAWERISLDVRETDALNIDKKSLILLIFDRLAKAKQAAMD